MTAPEARKSPLALVAKEGDHFTFLVTPWRDHLRAGESKGKDERRSAGGESRDYRIIVKEVAPSGDITLLVACNGLRHEHPRVGSATTKVGSATDEQRAEPEKGEANDAAKEKGESRVTTVTIGRDGCLKHAPGSAISGLPELQSQLRFIFGCGLHEKDLQVGEVYPLAALYKEPAERSVGSDDPSAIYLRFEGMTAKQGDQESARFSVVTRDDAALTPSRGRSGESAPRKGSLETVGSAQTEKIRNAVDQTEWKRVGEVVYRTGDGFLERLSLIGGLPSRARSAVSMKGKTMSILRIHTAP